MKKRLLSLLLILCLCAALLPVAVFAEDNVTIVKTEEELKDAIEKGGSIQLGEKIELAAVLEINNTVTLDLNGHVITKDVNAGGIKTVSIGDGGHLTLTDSSNGIGAISDFDGSVHVLAGGTFTMNGGRLLAGRALGGDIRARGGGVLVDKDGLFVMNGGSIESCLANGDGGGVFIASSGMFEMSGGSIEGCCAWINGGGVYVNTNGTFKMSGGTIRNNRLSEAWGGEGAGVYVANGATATLITSNITGNTKTGGKEDNITAPGGYKEYEPPVAPIDPDYPLISILPALAKDLPFTDVTSTDWFYSDVKYAYETGLMTGTAADAFSPEAPVTRGMVMTILARREGIRTDRYTPWYAAGCEWAKANGISDGSNPEAPVTREQLAAMLYRYAALKGRDLTAGENLNFTDASDVSAYALPALQWATGEKILTGSNGALNPQATATRAQLAAILHRYFG